MPVSKREVRPIEVNYICDACGTGMMSRCGDIEAKTGNIEHRCLICDHKQIFQWEEYPRIDHIGVNEKL